MQEFIGRSFSHNDISVNLDQYNLIIKTFVLFINPKIQIPIEQISYIKLRKEFVFWGKQGFEINYRLYPKGVLLGFFFVSKQPQAWINAFTAVGIKIID